MELKHKNHWSRVSKFFLVQNNYKEQCTQKKWSERWIVSSCQSVPNPFDCYNYISWRSTRIIPVTFTTKWYRVWVKSKFVSASHYHRYEFTKNTCFPHHMLHLTRINIGIEWCYVPVPFLHKGNGNGKETDTFYPLYWFLFRHSDKRKISLPKKTFNMFVAICLMCKRVDWRKIISGRWVCEDMVLT